MPIIEPLVWTGELCGLRSGRLVGGVPANEWEEFARTAQFLRVGKMDGFHIGDYDIDKCLNEWRSGRLVVADDVINPLPNMAHYRCNAYYSTIDVGIWPHFDNHTVVSVQLQGTKRWYVGPDFSEQAGGDSVAWFLGGGGLQRADDGKYYWLDKQWVSGVIDVMPGAIIEIPGGVVHSTKSLSPKCLSLSLSLR